MIALRSTPLLVWMIAAIAVVASFAYWDSARESELALQDFADEEASLAVAGGAAVEAKLRDVRKDTQVIARELVAAHLRSNAPVSQGRPVTVRFRSDPPPPVELLGEPRLHLELPFDEQRLIDVTLSTDDLLGGLRNIEGPGRVLLLQRPGYVELVARDGHRVQAEPIAAALERGARSLRLSRPEARALGLPERTAMAGLATIDAGPFGRWGLAVVTSAERQRDREIRARWRLVGSVVAASGLVLVFGGMALRKQRKELLLSREIAVAEARNARDERLVRADKLATMGALATGIAHEVSTPLGVIQGRAEQLAPRVATDEKSTRMVEAILAQAERITRIVRAFLGLARGEAPVMAHVDPAAIARACTDLVAHRFEKAGVALALDAPFDLPQIACDTRLFEQAIVNLLLNACDACGACGHVELRVQAEADRVAFVVTDDGAGITEEAAQRAVEPCFTTKAAGEGTGLGLAIANEIVKHHQGTLRIAPREGTRGTTARVDVPAAPRSETHG